jgi:hypothetical protein
MPQAPRVPKRTRSKKTAAGFSDTPRIISEQEKHQLIQAHVAARVPQDPLQRVSLWAGVSLSLVMIVAGWWMTVGWAMRHTAVQDGSAEIRAATEQLKRFTDLVNNDPSLGLDALRNPTPSASASSFEELMNQNLNTSSRRNLIAPGVTTSTTHPSGLTPDE